MKSIALIVWLLAADGREQIVARNHLDDMASCEAEASAVAMQYAQQGKTRHLCHIVVPEVEAVDPDGNPIEP